MGYDITRFQGKIHEEFICTICSDVLEEPLQAPQCEHAFCKSCISEWLKKQPSCPVDRQPVSELKPVPRIMRNLLSELLILCDNATFGCTVRVKLEGLDLHLEECEYNPKRRIPHEQMCGLVKLTVVLPPEHEASTESSSASGNTQSSNNITLGTRREGEPLSFLRNQPQFQQMIQVIQQNPQLLNAVLQQIGQSNPQLLQLISQNQESFVRMLNEPAASQGSNLSQGSGGTATSGGGAGFPIESSLGQATAQVSPQDREAIERLKALGYPEYLVVQAYFACDKIENLAANFLLAQNLDD